MSGHIRLGVRAQEGKVILKFLHLEIALSPDQARALMRKIASRVIQAEAQLEVWIDDMLVGDEPLELER